MPRMPSVPNSSLAMKSRPFLQRPRRQKGRGSGLIREDNFASLAYRPRRFRKPKGLQGLLPVSYGDTGNELGDPAKNAPSNEARTCVNVITCIDRVARVRH